MIAAIFGIFIALSPMTSLRGESSVGLIDAGLIIFAALTIATSMAGRKARTSTISVLAANPVYAFTGLGALAITLATLINLSGYSIYFIDPMMAILPLIVTFFCGIAMAVALSSRDALTLLRSFALASLLVGIMYIAGALIGFGPFFYGPRFSGLSLNPNQTAMFALCGSLTALVLMTKTPPSTLRMTYAATVVVCMIVGIMTKSDAFMVCSVLVVFCVAYLIAFRFIRSFLGTIVLGVFAALVMVALAAALAPEAFGSSADMVQASFSSGNQDTDRELLWRNGMAAWRERPLFGNGAGAWSGISSPYQAFEAHNSFVDWLSMVGIVGAAPLAYCTLFVLRLNFKQHVVAYIGVLALLTFFMFHFVFRLPPVWLAWMALLTVEIRNEGAVFPSMVRGLALRPWRRDRA